MANSFCARSGATWLVTLLVVAGCTNAAPQRSSPQSSAGESQKASSQKRIVAAALGEPATLSAKVNAVQIPAPGADVLEELVNAGVAQGDSRGGLRPQLAEAVPTLDNGLWKLLPDRRMETTWRLKPGAQWHDGAPFTSDDILFSARLAMDKEVAVFRDAAFDAIETVEALDSRTIVVRWNQPFIEADLLFTKGLLPKHLLEKPYLDEKAGFTQLPYWNQEFIGLGPYKLREWASGSRIVIEAFDHYILGRPTIDEIEVRFISDPSTVIANILAGSVDVTFGRGLSVEQAILVRDQWQEGRIELGFINTWLTIFPQFVNPSPTVISEVRFRKALMHTMDRGEIAENVQHGLVPVAHSFLGPNQPQYQEIEARIPRYEYDPSKAAQMIGALGYAKGPDGMLRDATNQKLEVELRTVPTDISSKTTFAVADSWQRAGVGVEPVIIPVQRQRDQEYVATFPGFTLFRQPLDVRRLKSLHSAQAPLAENNYRVTGNNARYMNSEFDVMIERFYVTVPIRERIPILGELIYHIADQLPMFPLFYDAEPVFLNNRVKKAGGKTLQSTQAWNVQEWTVR